MGLLGKEKPHKYNKPWQNVKQRLTVGGMWVGAHGEWFY